MVYVIFVCFAVPLALMLPFIKGQSRLLIAFMLIGEFMAVSSSEINGVIQTLLNLSSFDVALRIAPLVEEIMKAIPILIYALLFNYERENLMPPNTIYISDTTFEEVVQYKKAYLYTQYNRTKIDNELWEMLYGLRIRLTNNIKNGFCVVREVV